jgi:hypothetical protein
MGQGPPSAIVDNVFSNYSSGLFESWILNKVLMKRLTTKGVT